ncbi:hypothetical protein Tco_0885635, partial [Tanacetum coccineum]
QVPRSENKKADALSKIASTSFAHLTKQVLVEALKEKSINEAEVLTVVEEEGNTDDPNLQIPHGRNTTCGKEEGKGSTTQIKTVPFRRKREQAAIREARSMTKMEKYYNSKVRNTIFKPGDLVYRNNDASHAEDGGKLGPKWEGPYEVVEALGKGAYKLRDCNGKLLPRTWNVCNLKKCYIHEM